VAEYYRCRRSFFTSGGKDAGPVLVRAGRIVTDEDPLFKRCPEAFVAIAELVEQTTAAPGERRSLSHLRKRAARKGKAGDTPPEQPPADDGKAAEQPDQPDGGAEQGKTGHDGDKASEAV
jgi:hypothetical protein